MRASKWTTSPPHLCFCLGCCGPWRSPRQSGRSFWKSPWTCWRGAPTRSSPSASVRGPLASSFPHRPPAPWVAHRCSPCTTTSTRSGWGRWWCPPHKWTSREQRALQTPLTWWWWHQVCRGPGRTKKSTCSGRPHCTQSPLPVLPVQMLSQQPTWSKAVLETTREGSQCLVWIQMLVNVTGVGWEKDRHILPRPKYKVLQRLSACYKKGQIKPEQSFKKNHAQMYFDKSESPA